MRNRIVTGIAAGLLVLGLGVTAAGTANAAPAVHPSTVKPHNVCNFTSATPILNPGSSGAAVKQLQCYLNDSLDDDHLTVDGSFGSLTEAAVLEFQGCDGLAVDGSVGPRTWPELKRVANGPRFCDAGDRG